MPTDPSDPNSSSLRQTTVAAPNRGGGGGIFFVILLLLVLGGGAAYYFLLYKPVAPTPVADTTPKAVATPVAATPVATATPNKAGEPTYGTAQRQQYIQTAIEGFREMRQSKYLPFTEAFSALTTAGGFSAASLSSKEAIASRREMVKKCLAANEDYTAFIKDQENAYIAELKKTPLVTNDVEVESSLTGAKMPTDKIVQLRTIQSDSLKTGDQMLDYLDSKFGAWSLNAEKHIVFKKSADGAPFTTLAKTYNEQVVSLNKLRDEINKNEAVDPTAATSTAADPTTATPAPTVTPAASVAP